MDSLGAAELPDVSRRVLNAAGWADAAARFGLDGVVTPAWSRNSAARVQCKPIDGALDALVKVALTLSDGHPPDDAATEALLRTAVEWDRFHACRSALARAPTHGAMQRRALNSARATDLFEAHNPVRVGSGVLGVLLSRAAASVSAAQVAADELPVALRNLVPDLWIRQFIEERMLPLKHMELRRYNRRRHHRD